MEVEGVKKEEVKENAGEKDTVKGLEKMETGPEKEVVLLDVVGCVLYRGRL